MRYVLGVSVLSDAVDPIHKTALELTELPQTWPHRAINAGHVCIGHFKCNYVHIA